MIKENAERILSELPANVTLVVAAKTRTPDEILQVIAAGVRVIGENYVQEAEDAFAAIGQQARWHFIGRLQKNKVKKAVEIFDMIETVDSISLAEKIDRQCSKIKRTISVLIEVNSGREPQKAGVLPEHAEGLIREISALQYLNVQGLMTMGPRFGDPEQARPYFRETKHLFDRLKVQQLPRVEMKILSMGMSNTYEIAIEEGATMVRIGTKIFGERE
jgi:pyridoxal phosphate enzyme (YggS family)